MSESVGHKLVSGKDVTSDEITQAIKELTAALEVECKESADDTINNLREGASLQVEDLTGFADDEGFLAISTKNDLQRKATTLLVKDRGKTYSTMCLTIVVGEDDVSKGLKMICDDLNALSRNNLIHSTLAPPSILALARMPLEINKRAIFSYVLVDDSRRGEAKKLVNNQSESGEINDCLSRCEPVLPEGQVLAVVRLTNFISNPLSVHQQLHEEIQRFLTLLPKGTELVGVTKCAITDLSLPYELCFYNPLLAKFKQVELEYVRECAVVNGKLEQYSRFLGILYTRRDGTRDCSDRTMTAAPAEKGSMVIA